ncbi:MAG: hypothetical protein HYY25_12685 [Candidatus Wallbacteria bacterium]|nr:hypothetical protein [Candidatus Wallbacteria bacterium]
MPFERSIHTSGEALKLRWELRAQLVDRHRLLQKLPDAAGACADAETVPRFNARDQPLPVELRLERRGLALDRRVESREISADITCSSESDAKVSLQDIGEGVQFPAPAAPGQLVAELALRAGLSTKSVNRIVKGIEPLSQHTALRLERVTGVPAHFWNAMEARYREHLTRKQHREELRPAIGWLKELPIRELVGRQVIPDSKDKLTLLESVLRFFGVNSPDEWHRLWMEPQVPYLRSTVFQSKPGSVAAWLRLGELEARRIATEPFDRARFQEALVEIRGLASSPPHLAFSKMKEICRTSGVASVVVPEVRGARVAGATRWLASEEALIQISLRFGTDDLFWFTFINESTRAQPEPTMQG